MTLNNGRHTPPLALDAMPPQPSFEALPRHIVTSSILPFVTSGDWLNFRLASRTCYDIVHGHGSSKDVAQFECPTCRRRAGADSTSTHCHDVPLAVPTISCDTELSEALWKIALVRDFQFDESKENHDLLYQAIHCPDGDRPPSEPFLSTKHRFTTSNLFVAWLHWRRLDLKIYPSLAVGAGFPPSGQLSGPYYLRACSMWRKVEQWIKTFWYGDVMNDSLLPGRRVLHPYDGSRMTNTQAFQAVYAFYAGQCDETSSHFHPYTGFFGGFQVYNTAGDMRWTSPYFNDEYPNHIIVSQGDLKDIILDMQSGQMYSFTDDGKQLVATPCAAGITLMDVGAGVTIEEPTNIIDAEDSILRWFEEHADRLHRHYYSYGQLYNVDIGEYEPSFPLLKYPSVADTVHCSRAVTRGLEVIASAIFVEEYDEIPVFVYSIRVRLLTQAEGGDEYLTPEQRGFEECQLVSRHWTISTKSPQQDQPSIIEVQGDGVVGRYPCFLEGGFEDYPDGLTMFQKGFYCGPFTYQSLVQADGEGSMEGYFEFVPGSRENPTGETFNVRVSPFPLKYPEFLY